MGHVAFKLVQKSPSAVQAHQVAQSGKSLDDLRRFEIAWVRRKAQGRAPPAAFLQADLDFVTDSKKSIADSALLDAELIKTICEVLHPLRILQAPCLAKIILNAEAKKFFCDILPATLHFD